ncbi:MBL fold metallo-hydrolase [Loktanella sp. D2R18]|uniref:MBL fold metallo-hydrolase n=1 Tax=Rhodobacterales TaxID=204455 RepID=UPI000DE87B66|nr:MULTISPECIES: MBL fold metallo-hydrolase [Rhodobacterales]MDO6591133.1 MBL fold metallo-hydrolase [Yoonia sp. 1_MG-2023]RBW41410.1 MBL fold metallo-hydrolase [Loktanella sp. D2R18]
MTLITRRTALFAGAAAPFAIAAAPQMAAAAGHSAVQNAVQNTFDFGEFQVSTLLAGTRAVEDVQTIFGMNVSEDEFAAVSAENFIPADKAQFFFTPTVVRAAGEVVLFDTGLSAAGTTAALAQAGIAPGDVTIVVITHMHGDHIGGLTDDSGAETFPNARYVTGQVEYDHWAAAGNEGFDAKMRPLAEKTSFIGDGESVVSGITSVAAYGHTPGHMGYMLESNGEQVMLMVDAANHYVWSLAYPEWEVRFDADKEAAANTRKQILGMAAADRFPVIGYHMPFPGMGYVEEVDAARFRYVPASYQHIL